ncbi:hypothetical protein PUN28_019494 [Cardiocondyla obscurior]|uniref:Uncharacterized protein n=1 Tax=Cardiocondyla obscurior TaxID=286306 RepID=A0AAW2ECU3_9HYME
MRSKCRRPLKTLPDTAACHRSRSCATSSSERNASRRTLQSRGRSITQKVHSLKLHFLVYIYKKKIKNNALAPMDENSPRFIPVDEFFIRGIFYGILFVFLFLIKTLIHCCVESQNGEGSEVTTPFMGFVGFNGVSRTYREGRESLPAGNGSEVEDIVESIFQSEREANNRNKVQILSARRNKASIACLQNRLPMEGMPPRGGEGGWKRHGWGIRGVQKRKDREERKNRRTN